MNKDFPDSETWGALCMDSKDGVHGDMSGELAAYFFYPLTLSFVSFPCYINNIKL